jgi:hypothetical protein
MALFDWIRDRYRAKPADRPKPRIAREGYTQRRAEEKASAKSIYPEVRARADRVMETLDKGSFYLCAEPAAVLSSGTGGNSEPMRQKALSRDHVTFLLSPTTTQVGRVVKTPSHAPSKDSDEHQPGRPQAPSKSRGGWER